jgi:hypothetical protein
MAGNFIKKAIKRPGAFRAKARAAGAVKGSAPIPRSYVEAAEKSTNPTTRRQANLAETLGKLRPRR